MSYMDGMGEGSGVTLAKQIILKISAWITLCRMGNDFWTHKKRHSIQYPFSGSNSSNLFWQTKKNLLCISKYRSDFIAPFSSSPSTRDILSWRKHLEKHILCFEPPNNDGELPEENAMKTGFWLLAWMGELHESLHNVPSNEHRVITATFIKLISNQGGTWW